MSPKKSNKRMRIGFDIGGVISKYPDEFRFLLLALSKVPEIEIYIVTDMPRDVAKDLLTKNNIPWSEKRLLCGEWGDHGDKCKSVLMRKHRIEIMVDDRLDYIFGGVKIGLMVVPRTHRKYYAPSWIEK